MMLMTVIGRAGQLDSDGRIRFMNATKAIRAAQRKSPGAEVKQLIFTGEDFTPEAVLKLRGERLA